MWSFCKASRRLRALHGILFFKSRIQQELSIQGVQAGNTYYNFDQPGFRYRRLYLDVIINNVRLEGQLDSAADVNIISKDFLDKALPDWHNYKSAGKIKLTSASNNPIQVVATHWITFSLVLNDNFAIVQNPGDLLLSSDLIYLMRLSLSWSSSNGTPLISWTRKGKKYTVPVSREPRYRQATNTKGTKFSPHESKCIQFLLPDRTSLKSCEVSNYFDHIETSKCTQDLIILPTHSKISERTVQAMVLNSSSQPVFIPANSLNTRVLLEETGRTQLIRADDLIEDPELMPSLLDPENMELERYHIANLPIQALDLYDSFGSPQENNSSICESGTCLSLSALASTSSSSSSFSEKRRKGQPTITADTFPRRKSERKR